MSTTRQVLIASSIALFLLNLGCRDDDKRSSKHTSTAATAASAPATATADKPPAADPTGKWSFRIENQTVTGQCPVGKEDSGTLEIKKGPKGYVLVFLSGRECRPQSMCTFEGTLQGKTLSMSNRDKVDDEGGAAQNKLELTQSSATAMKGKGTSSYQHPQGFRCDWRYDVTLTRAK